MDIFIEGEVTHSKENETFGKDRPYHIVHR